MQRLSELSSLGSYASENCGSCAETEKLLLAAVAEQANFFRGRGAISLALFG